MSIGDIRNSLLPEGSLSARFTTTTGPDLNQVTGTIYVGAPAQQEQRVLWIKIEEILIPTGLLLHIVKGSQLSQLTIDDSIHIMATSSTSTSAAYSRSGSTEIARWR